DRDAALVSEQKAHASERVAQQERDAARAAKDDLRRTLYVAHLNLAQAAWEGNNPQRVGELLDLEKAASPDLCGFEWHYWRRQSRADLRPIQVPGLSQFSRFSANGARLASFDLPYATAGGDHPRAKVWDTATGKEITSVPMPATSALASVVLSPDGTRLAY